VTKYVKGEKGKYQLVVKEKSWETLKEKLKSVTRKTTSMTFDERNQKLKEISQGWLGYFRMASIQGKLKELDGWVRNRLRYCIWHLDKTSLFHTIDNVSEALLFNLKIEATEKLEIADFIIAQQGKPRTYAGTFAPTEKDLTQELILFTGERIKSNAGRCHIIGEEASRILRKLELKNDKVELALQHADIGLFSCISKGRHDSKYKHGTYCCKTCSCALWINLASGGLNNDTELLKAGLSYLMQHRDGTGRWNGFPYYYTLYVINEVETTLVVDEICCKMY
jgi:hypothetical protein